MFETIQYQEQDATAIITIARPQVYNALNTIAKLELIKALEHANASPAIRSIILTAEGKAFCSGQDLTDRTVNSKEAKIDIGHTLETEWNPLMNAILNSPKLVIGAINGVTAGAGLSLALACDIKMAAPGVRFIAGFTQIGLCPDAGLSFHLVRAMGYSQALHFALSGKPMLSEEMLSRGFINVIAEDVLQEARNYCRSINQLAPLAVQTVKKNFHAAENVTFEQVLLIEKEAQRMLGFSADYREGVDAFLEKRTPQFKGQ